MSKLGLQKQQSQSILTIRDGAASSVVCSKIQDAIKRREKLKGVILRRKRLNMALMGALLDLLLSQDSWQTIELLVGNDEKFSSKNNERLILQLLKASLSNNKSNKGHIDKLILIGRSQYIISWLGVVLGGGKDIKKVHTMSILYATFTAATGAISFSDGLRSSNCVIEKLDFSGSSFNKEAAGILGSGLKDCKTIREVCLSHCHLEDSEIVDLVGPLSDHPTLTTLTLDDNYCQEQGTLIVSKLLASTLLERLNLSNQNVWDNREYITTLTTALSTKGCHLFELDLSSNFLQDSHFESILHALQENRTLQHINLRNNRITDHGIQSLSLILPNLRIRTINLERNSYNSVKCLEKGLASNYFMTELTVKDPTIMLLYYLALNKGGRVAKQPNHISLSLWPLTLVRCSNVLSDEYLSKGIRPVDLVFDLLHGPALLDG